MPSAKNMSRHNHRGAVMFYPSVTAVCSICMNMATIVLYVLGRHEAYGLKRWMGGSRGKQSTSSTTSDNGRCQKVLMEGANCWKWKGRGRKKAEWNEKEQKGVEQTGEKDKNTTNGSDSKTRERKWNVMIIIILIQHALCHVEIFGLNTFQILLYN